MKTFLRALAVFATLPTLGACPAAPPTPSPPRRPEAGAVAPAPSPPPATGTVELRGGTATLPWRVTLEVTDQAARARALALAPILDAVVVEVTRQLDPSRADGELGRFNRLPTRRPQPLSGPALAVVATCLELGARTGGAFDVTAGPLRDLWSATDAPPDADAIETARARTGLKRLQVTKGMLRKDVVDLEVDAGAVIDSVAARGIVDALRERSFEAFRVEVGGAAVVGGGASDARPWAVTLSPDVDAPVVARLAAGSGLRAIARATAPSSPGTIDPRRARPVEHDVEACVAVGDDVVVVDAVANACLVVGADDLEATLRAFPGVEVWWRRRGGGTGATPGFPG